MQAPELTEIERLKLENTALKYNALQQQMQQIMRERQFIVEQIEHRLPDWKWSDPDGLVPRNGKVEYDDEQP